MSKDLFSVLDDDSDDDDLSMFAPSNLSQSSTSTPPRQSPEQKKQKEEKEQSIEVSGDDENHQNQKEDPEDQLQREINKLDIPFADNTTLLMWEIGRGKNKGCAFPCMVVRNHDEAQGFYENVDTSKELVRGLYIDIKKRLLDQVPKKSLVAYNAGSRGEDDQDTWSEKYMNMYRKKLKKTRSMTDQQRELEEIFLGRVLARTKQQELDSTKQPALNSSPSSVVRKETDGDKVDEQEDAERKAFCEEDGDSDVRTSASIVSPPSDKKESLKAGDIIAYYKPGTAFCRGELVESQVFEIRAKDKSKPLDLQRDSDFLPPEHRVKRVKAFRRGELVALEKPMFRSIDCYKLTSGTLAQDHRRATLTQHQGAVVDRILDRGKAKMEAAGLGRFSGMLMETKPKRRRLSSAKGEE